MMRTLSKIELAQFFQDTKNMLITGMSVGQILDSLTETADSPGLKHILSGISLRVRQGSGLADACAESAGMPKIALSVLRAGEKSGRLSEALLLLNAYYDRELHFEHKLKQALVYPTIMFVVLLGALIFISITVMPRITTLMPAESATHAHLNALSPAYLSVGIGVVFFFIISTVTAVFCFRGAEPRIYKVPFIGKIKKDKDIAVFLSSLVILLKGGIGALTALDEAGAVHQSPVSDRFLISKKYMLSGLGFGDAVGLDPFFPSMVAKTIKKGEDLGLLDEYCQNLADYYAKRFESKINSCIHLIQPVMLLVGGVFLSTMALGFLAPIYANLSVIAGG